jgi:hypothetical protein
MQGLITPCLIMQWENCTLPSEHRMSTECQVKNVSFCCKTLPSLIEIYQHFLITYSTHCRDIVSIEGVSSSTKIVNFYQTGWCHIPGKKLNLVRKNRLLKFALAGKKMTVCTNCRLLFFNTAFIFSTIYSEFLRFSYSFSTHYSEQRWACLQFLSHWTCLFVSYILEANRIYNIM